MPGKNLVCNLNPIIYFRFLLGFRQNFQSSVYTRLISILYPIILASTVVTLGLLQIKRFILLHKVIVGSEYLVYVLVSFLTKDEYIYSNYKHLNTIDSFPDAKKEYRKLDIFAKSYLCFFIGYRFLSILIYFYSHVYQHEAYLTFFFSAANEMGRFSMLLLLGLLYSRTKVVKMALERADFRNSLQNRFAVIKYIQMYETLAETAKNIARHVKFLSVVILFSVIPRTLYALFLELSDIRRLGTTATHIEGLCDYVVLPIIVLIVASVTLDLIADNITDMQNICVEKRFLCSNERDRSELQQLLDLIKHRPIHNQVCGTVPLSTSLMLSCFSFCILNIIATLQIRSFYQ